MSNHTPGPWSACRSGQHYDVISGDSEWVQTICSTNKDAYVEGMTDVQVKANARLIAAAPDLLDAAKLALKEAESWIHDQLDGTGAFEAAWDELASVRTAIAKAEGRS